MGAARHLGGGLLAKRGDLVPSGGRVHLAGDHRALRDIQHQRLHEVGPLERGGGALEEVGEGRVGGGRRVEGLLLSDEELCVYAAHALAQVARVLSHSQLFYYTIVRAPW